MIVRAEEVPVKKLVLLTVTQVLLLSFAAHANDWTKEDVKDVSKKVKAGEMVDMSKNYPAELTQAVWISTPTFQYLIDIRAKSCYIRASGTGLTSTSCKALKTGYPLFAPIIDWEK